ncbi:hypothetical protein BCR34DRAFT_575392 [Clohesyomyces aquaticus]|uniref:Uncharacterized protein n=1 Tax=Clohesyomyces aquaticus TaxID=1231657 RepID=A0A1Y1YSV5_9PLEO|nr:hypothetical protein BCR34DRAFT_575392 [Clohesyomyces aquaticus]
MGLSARRWTPWMIVDGVGSSGGFPSSWPVGAALARERTKGRTTVERRSIMTERAGQWMLNCQKRGS